MSGSATFRPLCINGKLQCPVGQIKTPKICADVGGTCKGIGDCGVGAGHMSNISCNKVYLTCCIPSGQCGGPEDFKCCKNLAKFRPRCVDGLLECAPDQHKCN